MRVVLDTNILLVSISRRSPYNWIFQHLRNGSYTLCVSTEILAEYAEIIERHMGYNVSEAVLQSLLELPNVELIDVYYRWNLIKDQDDNKFTDCAIASRSHYLVSNDNDFSILKKIDFPKVELIKIVDFEKILKNPD